MLQVEFQHTYLETNGSCSSCSYNMNIKCTDHTPGTENYTLHPNRHVAGQSRWLFIQCLKLAKSSHTAPVLPAEQIMKPTFLSSRLPTTRHMGSIIQDVLLFGF